MVITQKASSTSSSNAALRFALRCVLFFAPIAAALAFAVLSLWLSGELASPREVIDIQKASPALYYPKYTPKSPYPAYKVEGASLRHPRVLVLGSSRGFSIRSEFAREPQAFYNAAMFGADQIGVIRQFLEQLPPGSQPQVVILIADPWWFRGGAEVRPEPGYFEPASRMQIIDFAWRNGMSWGVRQGLSARPANLIGINAQMQHSGLRPDGSFHAGKRWLDNPNDSEDYLKDLRNHAGPWFSPGPRQLSTEAVAELKRFLAYSAAHRIQVIAYMSTFHPVIYAAIQRDPQLNYYWHVAPVLAPVFRDAGASFSELQDPAQAGCSAAEYLDHLHESEVCTVRVLLDLSQSDPHIGEVFNLPRLRSLLDNRASSWQLGLQQPR